MASLVDTNILVYRCDPIDPKKSAKARKLLRDGVEANELYLPHQALIEFVNAVSKRRTGGRSLLSPEETWRQAEDLLNEFPVLYPDEKVFRIAMLGMAAYRLPWYDATCGHTLSTVGCLNFSRRILSMAENTEAYA